MEENSLELKSHALDYLQILKNRWGVILLTFLLVLLVAAVVTYISPRLYQSSVLMEVRLQQYDMKVFEGDSMFQAYTLLQTQFEIIRSRENLYRVIEKLNLAERWGLPSRSVAYGVLSGMTKTNSRRGTDLIEIEVTSGDPEESAEIANAVAEEYKKRRVQEEDEQSLRAQDSLDLQLEKMQEQVRAARSRYMDLIDKYRIFDLGSSGGPWNRETQTGDQQLLNKSQNLLFDAKNRIELIKSNIKALQDLTIDEIIDQASSLNISDSHLRQKFDSFHETELNRQKALDSGLGEKHHLIILVDNQLLALKQQLKDEAERYKESLDHSLALAQDELVKREEIEREQENEVIDTKRRMINLEEARNEYRLKRELDAEMRSKLRTSEIDQLMSKTPAVIHNWAEPNPNPAKPNVRLNLLLGAVVGLVSGLVLALFLEYMDTSVKNLEDVEKYLQVPVLAVVPQDVGVLHRQSGNSPDAEAYRILRTNIEFNREDPEANAIGVVSGGAGEGKTTTLVNLAYVCARGGHTTLLIDADLRRPALHKHFDVSNSFGLTNYLTSELALEDVILQTPIENLFFLPSGILPADAAGILNSKKMSELLADVKSRFDLVFVDSPPIIGVSESSVIASKVDMTMIVIQHRKLPCNMLLRVKQAIVAAGGHIVGAVLNNVDIHSDSQYQYYTSYYSYYQPVDGDGETEEMRQLDPGLYDATRVDKKYQESSSNQQVTLGAVTSGSPFGAQSGYSEGRSEPTDVKVI